VSAISREEIRGWVQTSAILIAGIWAAYTFVYKEIVVPKSVPINITMDLNVKRIMQKEAVDSNSGSIFPVEISVNAKNPSTRSIYLLSSAWWAYGINVERHKTDKAEFDQSVIDALHNTMGEYAERYTMVSSESLVASGSLFSNTSLKPEEIIKRTLIIYLPPRYDKLKLVIQIPASGKDPAGKLELRWDESRKKILRGFGKNGAPEQIPDERLEETFREFELQFPEAISETSLRQ
jgi:hypothetical protein